MRVVLALAIVLVSTTPARAQSIDLPVRFDVERITVRAEAGLEGVAADIARTAPGVLEGIYQDLPDRKRPPHVEIRLVFRSSDLGRAAPPGRSAPAWAAGVAYGSAGVVVVATRSGPNPIDVRSTVAHELAHMALDAALGDHAPRWLHEGFAYLHSSDWSFDRMRTLTGMAWTGDVIDLGELDGQFGAREQEASRAYAQSYDFVVYLARRGRSTTSDDDGDRWPFRAFLAGLADGASLDEAAQAAYGASARELFSEWYEDLRQRYLLLPVGMVSMGVWVLAALLLIVGYIRRRRQNRRRMAVWQAEDDAAEAARVRIDED